MFKAGLLTRSEFCSLPGFTSDVEMTKFLKRTYSCGYSSGFPPDSLLRFLSELTRFHQKRPKDKYFPDYSMITLLEIISNSQRIVSKNSYNFIAYSESFRELWRFINIYHMNYKYILPIDTQRIIQNKILSSYPLHTCQTNQREFLLKIKKTEGKYYYLEPIFIPRKNEKSN